MKEFALSIRQPWAWLIVNGFKDIENRTWHTSYQGRLLIHAAKGMTHREYEETAMFLVTDIPTEIVLPRFEALERGGIVGEANLVRCVTQSPSPWFVGPFGFVLLNTRPLPFKI